jgi:hypothetical protein
VEPERQLQLNLVVMCTIPGHLSRRRQRALLRLAHVRARLNLGVLRLFQRLLDGHDIVVKVAAVVVAAGRLLLVARRAVEVIIMLADGHPPRAGWRALRT